MKKLLLILSIAAVASCQQKNVEKEKLLPNGPFIQVLGVVQDAGYPQINCFLACCQRVRSHPEYKQRVVSMAIVDPHEKKFWLLDCGPDFIEQYFLLQESLDVKYELEGIFLSHAHIGHYTGIMHLGREAMNASNVPVYVLPRMKNYLENNGPWSLLVDLKNVKLIPLKADSSIFITPSLKITPWLVPHRDEFSETAAFSVKGPTSSAIFMPDIDKWHLWDRDIVSAISESDIAFLDGTFYKNGEIPGRGYERNSAPFY